MLKYIQMNTNSSFLANKKLIFFVIGIVFALIIAGGLMAATNRDPLRENLQRASLRYAAVIALTNDAQEEIGNSELYKINSEASLFLSSGSASISAELASRYGTKIPKEITASETDTTTPEKLNQASLLARYDPTYRQALTQKIESLDALLIEMIGQTRSKSLLATLKDAQGDTSTLLKQLRALKI